MRVQCLTVAAAMPSAPDLILSMRDGISHISLVTYDVGLGNCATVIDPLPLPGLSAFGVVILP